MGNGLKKVAVLCSGLTVTDGKTTVEYDKQGVRKKITHKKADQLNARVKYNKQDSNNR